MSLIKDVIPAYKIYAGVPANKIGDRSKMLRFIKDIEEKNEDV